MTQANSICIPRAFANISENRVRKVFDKLAIFTIDHIDLIDRNNEKGEPYKRIFVHIKEWNNTVDAQKAKERLLSGKELKIVYDDPWFWKVSLNTWTQKPQTALHNRKPRIRIDFDEETEKNSQAASQLLENLTVEEDRRPYRERRIDPVYCEQDVKQGFRDRRQPRPVKQEPVKQEPVKQSPPFVMNHSVAIMIATYLRIGINEVTEEIYRNNAQYVRDIRRDEMDKQKDEDIAEGRKPLDYSKAPANPPKRKQKVIIS
jgi:hypothetical protein